MADEELIQQQRKEKKDLQAQIQKIKHGVPKGDKKRKKEAADQVAKLEQDLNRKHNKELAEISTFSPPQEQDTGDIEEQMENLSTLDGDDFDASVEQVKKPSKAQKRRDKKVAQEKERQMRIKEQELQNLNGARHLEAEKLKSILQELNLTIHEIASDGNCLYNAVCHQLSLKHIKATNKSLRSQTAEYMLAHSKDFTPFLTPQESESLCPEKEYQKYCNDIASTTAWGGQMEIMALSHILKLPIKIIQAEGTAIDVGQDYKEDGIMLTYHRHAFGLGEHYNSVKPLSEKQDDGF